MKEQGAEDGRTGGGEVTEEVGRKVRGKVRARRTQSEEDDWEQGPRRVAKDECPLEGYIRIVDYLRKIDFESSQQKMNPYHALTASCFWFLVSAEYYSHNFFNRRGTFTDAAQEVLDRVRRLPLTLPNRGLKFPPACGLLPFETEELRTKVQDDIIPKLSPLIALPLTTRAEIYERKSPITSVFEDQLFISTLRATLLHFVQHKIATSQRWQTAVQQQASSLLPIAPKKYQLSPLIHFVFKQQTTVELSFNLRRVKKGSKDKLQSQEKLMAPFDEEHNHHLESPNSLHQQLPPNESIAISGVPLQQQPQVNNCTQINNSLPVQPMQWEQINEQMQQQFPQGTKYYRQSDIILDSILHLPLQKVISMLQSMLPSIKLPSPEPSLMPVPSKDPLQFVLQLHPQQEAYLQVMKTRQRQKYRVMFESNNVEYDENEWCKDAKCQVCADGDYTEDNLIVFCSMCNISLHQKCIGLSKVPNDSWVCEVCLAFGPAGVNLPCPLCQVKGGAMKKTPLKMDSPLFRDTNPDYYDYSAVCMVRGAEGYPLPDTQTSYYDYFIKDTYPPDQPYCQSVWVHFVCAIWIPQCYFQEKTGIIAIRGVENVQKKRFRQECFVCRRTRSGAAIKCQEHACDRYYHPECARRKNIHMEQFSGQKVKYLIFCQEHQPIKLAKLLDEKKKKTREQIIKFTRMIEKYIETYKIAQFPYKLIKTSVPVKCIKEEPSHPPASKSTDEQFMKKLMRELAQYNEIKVSIGWGDEGPYVKGVHQPSRREIKKCLKRQDNFWMRFVDPYQEPFKRYERIVVENPKQAELLDQFMNSNMTHQQKVTEKRVGRKRGKHALKVGETMMEEDGGVFCVCKRKYNKELDMFECDVCGEWFHYACIGFIGDQNDAQDMEFHCMKCMKFEEEYVKRVRLQKNAQLFRQDSILYTYRPPTPELVSGDQEETYPSQPIQLTLDSHKPNLIPTERSKVIPNFVPNFVPHVTSTLVPNFVSDRQQLSLHSFFTKTEKQLHETQHLLEEKHSILQSNKKKEIFSSAEKQIQNEAYKEINGTQMEMINQIMQVKECNPTKLTQSQNHIQYEVNKIQQLPISQVIDSALKNHTNNHQT